MKARGQLVADGSEVDVIFGKNSLNTRLRVPVVKDPITGEIVGARGFGGEAREELAKVQKGLGRKGRGVIVEGSEQLESRIRSRFSYDRREVAHGLGKIAYLMTVWALGDPFIQTAGAAQYRAWIEAEPNDNAFRATGLRILPIEKIDEVRPEAPRHFHVLTCLRIGQQVATTVQLFGQPLLGFGALVDIPELRICASKNLIVLIDPVNKTFDESEMILLC